MSKRICTKQHKNIHQVLRVTLRLCELHLVHAFTGVPMQEGSALEHGSELRMCALEDLLDGCRVSEGRSRLRRQAGIIILAHCKEKLANALSSNQRQQRSITTRRRYPVSTYDKNQQSLSSEKNWRGTYSTNMFEFRVWI